MKVSAPCAARGWRCAEFLPTARTFCPAARRLFATTCPVLPLAPSTTYIKLPPFPPWMREGGIWTLHGFECGAGAPARDCQEAHNSAESLNTVDWAVCDQ